MVAVASLAAPALTVVPLTTFAVALIALSQSLPLGAHPLLLALVKAAMDFGKGNNQKKKKQKKKKKKKEQQEKNKDQDGK
jgi:hypothetical protein